MSDGSTNSASGPSGTQNTPRETVALHRESSRASAAQHRRPAPATRPSPARHLRRHAGDPIAAPSSPAASPEPRPESGRERKWRPQLAGTPVSSADAWPSSSGCSRHCRWHWAACEAFPAPAWALSADQAGRYRSSNPCAEVCGDRGAQLRQVGPACERREAMVVGFPDALGCRASPVIRMQGTGAPKVWLCATTWAPLQMLRSW